MGATFERLASCGATTRPYTQPATPSSCCCVHDPDGLCSAAANCRFMGGRRYPVVVHRMAVEAWILAGKPDFTTLCQAIKLFNEMLSPSDRPENPRYFIEYWFIAWKERSSVCSKSPSPRRRIVTDDTARECIEALKRGYMKKRRLHYFRSFRQAVAISKEIQDVLATHIRERGRKASHQRASASRCPPTTRLLPSQLSSVSCPLSCLSSQCWECYYFDFESPALQAVLRGHRNRVAGHQRQEAAAAAASGSSTVVLAGGAAQGRA